jgi:CheY-like chemotaxis protein
MLERASRQIILLPSLAGDTTVGHKLLIVEDNPTIRELLAVALGEAGFSVVLADDGCTGLECARREQPDLIITDIEMPNLDGIQMIQRLRQDPELEGTPVVVVSAMPTGALMRAVASGASEVVQKPVSLLTLIKIARQILGLTLSLMAALSIFACYVT